MVDWPPVIDADGHVLERQSDIRKYLEPPCWNFHKYLLDRAGQPVAAFESAVEPEDSRVTAQIEKLLK